MQKLKTILRDWRIITAITLIVVIGAGFLYKNFSSEQKKVIGVETRSNIQEKQSSSEATNTNTNSTDDKSSTAQTSEKTKTTPASTSTSTSIPTQTSIPATPTTPTVPVIDPFIANWVGVPNSSYLNSCAQWGSRHPCPRGYTFIIDVGYVDSQTVEPIIIDNCVGSGSYATNGYRDSNPPNYQYPVTGVKTAVNQCRYSFTAPDTNGFFSIHTSATTSSNTPQKTKLFLNEVQVYTD